MNEGGREGVGREREGVRERRERMETEGGRGSRGTVGGRKFPQLPKM